jgi:putative tryptophan/tyrosine transport system substrate-binding protein
MTIFGFELAAKRLEMLHAFVPTATLIAHLVNPTNQAVSEGESRLAQAAAHTLGVRLLTLSASTPSEIDAAFERLIHQQAGGLLISSDPFLVSQRDQFVVLAAARRVPVIYDRKEAVAAGGLISYGASLADAYRQVGTYTGRILKGEKPADLPVQQSVKIELVLNLNTAKALGLNIPETLLATADEVIQ